MAVDPDLVGLFREVFGDWRASRGPSKSLHIELDRPLWTTLEQLGLTRLTDPEGANAGWPSAAALVREAAAVAAPTPLVENDLLGQWLLRVAGLDGAPGIVTAGVLDAHGASRSVPWASQVDTVVVIWPRGDDWYVADVAATDVTLDAGWDLAGQPRDQVTVAVEHLEGARVDAVTVREFTVRARLARAVQMTGAMSRIVGMCVEFALDRHQFGRPIASFQAVQHLIASVASETALATAAVDGALTTITFRPADLDEVELRVAIARSVAGHASTVVVRNAHQVHGAIGTTFEHELREFTNPILAWRGDYGSLAACDQWLTDLLANSGDSVWSLGVPR